MVLALDMKLESISFPPLALGKNGFAKPRAARLIVQGIIDRLQEDHREVRIVCLDDEIMEIFRDKLSAQGWQGLNH